MLEVRLLRMSDAWFKGMGSQFVPYRSPLYLLSSAPQPNSATTVTSIGKEKSNDLYFRFLRVRVRLDCIHQRSTDIASEESESLFFAGKVVFFLSTAKGSICTVYKFGFQAACRDIDEEISSIGSDHMPIDVSFGINQRVSSTCSGVSVPFFFNYIGPSLNKYITHYIFPITALSSEYESSYGQKGSLPISTEQATLT
jgi:hypothetical protein